MTPAEASARFIVGQTVWFTWQEARELLCGKIAMISTAEIQQLHVLVGDTMWHMAARSAYATQQEGLRRLAVLALKDEP